MRECLKMTISLFLFLSYYLFLFLCIAILLVKSIFFFFFQCCKFVWRVRKINWVRKVKPSPKSSWPSMSVSVSHSPRGAGASCIGHWTSVQVPHALYDKGYNFQWLIPDNKKISQVTLLGKDPNATTYQSNMILILAAA